MNLIYAILLTLAPLTELRVGLPLALSYASQDNIPLFLIFILIVSLNIILIFLIYFFLDKIHNIFLKINFYKEIFLFFEGKFQKKIIKFEKRYNSLGFISLFFLVAIPLPGTGAWSGTLISWILGLDRRKSFLAIALGVLTAGIIIFFASLPFFL